MDIVDIEVNGNVLSVYIVKDGSIVNKYEYKIIKKKHGLRDMTLMSSKIPRDKFNRLKRICPSISEDLCDTEELV